MGVTSDKFRILVLDGGGSKGVYSIGVLKELEQKLGGVLHEHFDLIYGTSTGAIIASFIALGEKVEDIEKKYFELIPIIMSGFSRFEKSHLLKREAEKIFGERKFDSFKTDIGIVAMNYDDKKPLIFKSNVKFAHGLKDSFVPGFGCTIADAVQASCSAYPIFEIKEISTVNQGKIKTIDGGFIANNSTLFALIDAHKAFKVDEDKMRVLSIGVGQFVEKPLNWKYQLLKKIKTMIFVERVLTANTNTNDVLTKLIFPDLKIVRISDTFNQPEYGTNMLELERNKLEKMLQLGRQSFGRQEKDMEKFFK
jgi:patatin-like phospholipase/acyl hydrolase